MLASAPRLDPWSYFDHKDIMSAGTGRGYAPGWVSGDDLRRLNAYRAAAEYRLNIARNMLDLDADVAVHHREYGDPEMIVQSVRASVVGEGGHLAIDHAGDEDPPEPTDDDVIEGGDSIETLRAAWEVERAALKRARERQEQLDAWGVDELIDAKIANAENDCLTLGDVVWVFTADDRKRRVRAKAYDPGFYFPVTGDDDDDYPERVHIAWEWEASDGTIMVRRRTWELVAALNDEGTPTSRSYAYEPGVLSSTTCLYSDGDWTLDDIGNATHPDEFDEGGARWRIDRVTGAPLQGIDLNIDFIPVIHEPSSVSSIEEGWGTSLLGPVIQIIDDLAATDTDTAAAAALTANPVIGAQGVAPSGARLTSYGPGTVLWTQGPMEVLDLSGGLEQLGKVTDRLLARLTVNRQLTDSIVGRVQPENVPSGIALLLSWGPYRQLIADLRLVREPKYRLMVKFVQRYSIAAGYWDGPVLDGGFEFGTFLPNDLEAVAKLATDLIDAKIIRRSTGLQLMVDAGLDVTDVADESIGAQHEDFEGAGLLADAIGDEAAAAEYLGRTPSPVPTGPPDTEGQGDETDDDEA